MKSNKIQLIEIRFISLTKDCSLFLEFGVETISGNTESLHNLSVTYNLQPR